MKSKKLTKKEKKAKKKQKKAAKSNKGRLQEEQKSDALIQPASTTPPCIFSKKDSIFVWLGAVPNTQENAVKEIDDECISVHIAAPRVRGQANKELISYMSEVLGVGKNCLSIKKGGRSKLKILEIEDVADNKISIEIVYERFVAACK